MVFPVVPWMGSGSLIGEIGMAKVKVLIYRKSNMYDKRDTVYNDTGSAYITL